MFLFLVYCWLLFCVVWVLFGWWFSFNWFVWIFCLICLYSDCVDLFIGEICLLMCIVTVCVLLFFAGLSLLVCFDVWC